MPESEVGTISPKLVLHLDTPTRIWRVLFEALDDEKDLLCICNAGSFKGILSLRGLG